MKSTLWIWLLYNSVFWLLVVVIMLIVVWYLNFNKIIPPKYYTVSHILNISGVMRKYASVPPNPASHRPLGEQRNHHLRQDHTTGGQKKDGSGWWYLWYCAFAFCHLSVSNPGSNDKSRYMSTKYINQIYQPNKATKFVNQIYCRIIC